MTDYIFITYAILLRFTNKLIEKNYNVNDINLAQHYYELSKCQIIMTLIFNFT